MRTLTNLSDANGNVLASKIGYVNVGTASIYGDTPLVSLNLSDHNYLAAKAYE